MRVYRIENDEGIGAYSIFDEETDDYVMYGAQSSKHPLPRDDGLPRLWALEWDDLRFGFHSMEALFDWFDADMLSILRPHASISVYETLVYRNGGRQTVFDRAQATLIERIDL